MMTPLDRNIWRLKKNEILFLQQPVRSSCLTELCSLFNLETHWDVLYKD